MNINQKVETALSDIVTNIWPMCCPQERPPDEYIVYNPELEEAVLFADDQDREWLHHMQIHYFTKGNYIKKRRSIRKSLREAGFLVTDITTLKDSGYYHLCFECMMEEETEE